MTKKAIPEGGKKDLILSVALESFLENGYESTSVRSISQKAECEVGLIYYYFKTKEELFDRALESYYAKTEEEMRTLSEQNAVSVEKFIGYLEEKALSYRKAFENNVHFSVRSAVCEKITAFSEMYLTIILEKTRKTDAKNTALFLARGICGALLRDDDTYYQENKNNILKIANYIATTEFTEVKEVKESKEVVTRKREIPSFLL